MMYYVKSVVKWLLSRFGFRIYRISPPLGAFEVLDEFVDSSGNRFERLKGYRDSIWPTDWQAMNEARAKPDVQTVKKMNSVTGSRNLVAKMEKLLQIHSLTLVGKDVLDVGCFSGASTYALAEHGARYVEGIDVPENFADLLSEQANKHTIEEQSQYLKNLREATAHFFEDTVASRVRFYDLDVKNLIKKEAYDFIVSWSVLEHIIEPEKAFKSMYEALRSNGVCYHEYHPFFCVSGAHFDTLDFPWGHVRLSPRDFDRYIQTYRPEENAIAKKRFYSSINRMTLSDLRLFSLSAGFEIIELFEHGESWDAVDQTIFSQCKVLYPSLAVSDLITSNVLIMLRKKP